MWYSLFTEIKLLALDGNLDGATQVLNDSFNAAETINDAVNNTWAEVLNGPLYFTIARLGVAFAVGTMLIFFVQWAKALIDNEDSRAMSELIWPLIVIILLGNNAAVLRSNTYGLRNILNQTSKQVLSSTSKGLQLQSVFQQRYKQDQAQRLLQAVVSQCNKYPEIEVRNRCIDDAIKKVESEMPEIPDPGAWEKFVEFLRTPANEVVADAVSSSTETIVRGWLILFSVAFQIVIEITWVLTALLAPLAVGGTLLPIGQKAIFTWLIAFYSVGMVKICFSIIVGLTATVMANATGLDSTVFVFVVGMLAPILSVAMAAGGGMAVLNSLAQAGQPGATGAVSAISGGAIGAGKWGWRKFRGK
jgi:hypothetical protein